MRKNNLIETNIVNIYFIIDYFIYYAIIKEIKGK